LSKEHVEPEIYEKARLRFEGVTFYNFSKQDREYRDRVLDALVFHIVDGDPKKLEQLMKDYDKKRNEAFLQVLAEEIAKSKQQSQIEEKSYEACKEKIKSYMAVYYRADQHTWTHLPWDYVLKDPATNKPLGRIVDLVMIHASSLIDASVLSDPKKYEQLLNNFANTEVLCEFERSPEQIRGNELRPVVLLLRRA